MGGVNITVKILKSNFQLSEAEIDRIVVAQADDDQAWEEPVVVRKWSGTCKNRLKRQIPLTPPRLPPLGFLPK